MFNNSNNIIQDFVRYEYFNFHEICGSSHFEKCNPLLQKIESILSSFGYYHAQN
jgi:hypothetical protein